MSTSGSFWVPLFANKQRLLLLLISLKSDGADGCWMSGLAKLFPAFPFLWDSPRALPCPESRARGKDPSSFQPLSLSCRTGLLKDDFLCFL